MSAATSPPLLNDRYSFVQMSAAARVLAAGALLTSSEFIRIIGATVLTGAVYGIANDMIACRDCIEYFTVGHFYDGVSLAHRLVNSLNPNLNAVAWGTVATWPACAVAGVFLASIARIGRRKIKAKQLAPYLRAIAAVTFLVSHIASRNAQQQMLHAPYGKYWNVPLHLQAGWEACNIRNSTGYKGIGVGTLLLSIAMIASKAGLLRL